MPVTLSADKASVLPGGTIVFTVQIQGLPNITGITVSLGYRAEGSVNWAQVGTATVNTDADGYAETTFTFPIPSTQPLGNYEVMARAEKDTAYEDSNILTILVGEAVLALPVIGIPMAIGLGVVDMILLGVAAAKAVGVI